MLSMSVLVSETVSGSLLGQIWVYDVSDSGQRHLLLNRTMWAGQHEDVVDAARQCYKACEEQIKPW